MALRSFSASLLTFVERSSGGLDAFRTRDEESFGVSSHVEGLKTTSKGSSEALQRLTRGSSDQRVSSAKRGRLSSRSLAIPGVYFVFLREIVVCRRCIEGFGGFVRGQIGLVILSKQAKVMRGCRLVSLR